MSVDTPPIHIVLIGCGSFAEEAYLPALLKCREKVKLAAVIDLKSERGRIVGLLDTLGFPNGTELFRGVMPGTLGIDELKQVIEADNDNIEGVILSTFGVAHTTYLSYLLDECKKPIHILVDKPLTVTDHCTTSPGRAKAIRKEFEHFCDRAQKQKRIFMLATQRRYQAAYWELAHRLNIARRVTGWPLTFIQCLTADGWWPQPRKYYDKKKKVFHRNYDPNVSGGGKIVHTGYHLLDIIPWLMRNCSPAIKEANPAIECAQVVASVFRPMDSFLIIGDEAKNVVVGSGRGLTEWEELPEINAAVQVAFYRRDKGVWRTSCLLQLGMLHEGLSMKGHLPDKENRTKQEILSLTQGPVGAFWMRRIAKITPAQGAEIGGEDHLELWAAKNPHFVGGGLPLERIPTSYEENSLAPAEEFFEAIAECKQHNGEGNTASPVSDHSIGTKLLSAIYESCAKSYINTINNINKPPKPCCVLLEFNEDEWKLPPRADRYLREGLPPGKAVCKARSSEDSSRETAV